MPIIQKTPRPPRKAVGEEIRQAQAVVQKRQAKHGKFKAIRRKDRTPEDYEKVKMVVDGEEKDISNSSKFLLDMLIRDEE